MTSAHQQRFAITALVVGLLALTLPCPAQKQKQDKTSGYDRAARATLLHEAIVYVAADASTQRVSIVTPGHEVVVVERSGPWVKVFANTDVADDEDEDQKPFFAGLRLDPR